jgi:hypothetical protein
VCFSSCICRNGRVSRLANVGLEPATNEASINRGIAPERAPVLNRTVNAPRRHGAPNPTPQTMMLRHVSSLAFTTCQSLAAGADAAGDDSDIDAS